LRVEAVQKALPLFNDGGSIIMTGSVASRKGFPGFGVYERDQSRSFSGKESVPPASEA